MFELFEKRFCFDRLMEDYKRVRQLMLNGIQTEQESGWEYYTGYEDRFLFDWDQYFEAIIQLYMGWNTKYIKNGVVLFMDNQQKDGFIPRTVPVQPVEIEGSEHAKPFFAQIVLLLYKREMDLGWLNESYYEKLKRYLLYWIVDKRWDDKYLSAWDSGPHTGMDNQHERAGWWKDCISVGADLNSYLYRECEAFSIIAGVIGKTGDAVYFKDHAQKIKNDIQTYLWDELDGYYYDRNCKTGDIIRIKSVSGFAPLWAGVSTPEQAQRLVSQHLINPAEFWRPFPLPAYAANEKGYSENCLEGDLGCSWRANTWIPANYFVFQGLRRYGYMDIAGELAYKTYEMVKKIGEREYYTSESCTGCGFGPFWGWSLLAYFMPVEFVLAYDPTRIDIGIKDIVKITI